MPYTKGARPNREELCKGGDGSEWTKSAIGIEEPGHTMP